MSTVSLYHDFACTIPCRKSIGSIGVDIRTGGSWGTAGSYLLQWKSALVDGGGEDGWGAGEERPRERDWSGGRGDVHEPLTIIGRHGILRVVDGNGLRHQVVCSLPLKEDVTGNVSIIL